MITLPTVWMSLKFKTYINAFSIGRLNLCLKVLNLSYLNEMFSFRPFNETLQSLRSTGALDFYTPRPQKEIFKQSLIYSGPVIWNNLPDCLKNLETVDSFHRHCIKWMKSSLSFNL